MYENENEGPNFVMEEVAEVIEPSYYELKLKFDEAERLRESHKTRAETLTERLHQLNLRVERLKEYLRENWESLDDHAEELAEIFDFDMTATKTFTFTIDVEVEVTANSPAYDWSGFDGSEIDLEVSASVNYQSRNDLSDATVESTDVRECEEN